MPKVVEGITAHVMLDITDVKRGVAEFTKEYKKMARTIGGVQLKINDKEVKDLGQKSFAGVIKNLQRMQDVANKAKENIKSIDAAIQKLQASKMTSASALQLGGILPKQAGAAVDTAFQKLMDAQQQGGMHGIVKAQKEYNTAKNQAIKLLRQERVAQQAVIDTRMQEIKLTAGAKLNLVQRTMIERVQTMKAEKKELAGLMILHKRGLTTKEDLLRAQTLINNATARGTLLSGKYAKLRTAAAQAEKEHAASMGKGNLALGYRLKWFAQLRAFWGLYRMGADAAQALLEKDEAMGRALRTARFGGEIQDRTTLIKKYSQAINQVGRQFGTSFKDAGEALYQLGSAGLDSNESIAALNSTMQLLVGTEGDAREVTKAVASIYNNFGKQMTGFASIEEKMIHINSTLANTWRDHQVEISELVQGFALSSQMATAVGVKFEELSAMLGVLNTHMIKSGRAGRSLQNIWARISKQPLEFAATMGIALDPTKPLDFMGIMQQLNERMKSGAMDVASIGDMFERLGLRGAPAFAALIKHWDEVGVAMETNMKKGNEALKELEQEMTERFFVAGKRLWMNFITWLDETWVGSAVGIIRDGVVMIADLFEGGALKKEWDKMLADQEKFFQGLGGDIIDVDDLGRLKQMLEFAKRAGYTGEWVMKIKEKVVELEEKSLRITNEQTRAAAERAQLEKEAAAKGLEGAELEKWRLEIRKRDIMEQKTSMGNAQQKLAILKEQLAKEKETQAYYDNWAAGREGESRIVLEQNKKVRKLMGDIANIEKFITNEKEKQRKAIHKQIMEQAKATHKTTVSTMWADDPRHSDVGRMDVLKKQLEAERDFKLQMAQLELQDVQNSLVATMEEKEAAERTWTEKKKMINAEADKQIANTELQIQKSQAQFMLQHKTSVWQGGGGMGSGMLGAHSNFLQKQKSEQEAYQAWEANQTDENRERYEAAKEERIAGAVEVGRATVGAAADMMLQMAQQKKKYFKYYQMLSIAETVIATGQGVMQAYAQAGPYLGSVFAALITAMGAMKVAMIMKQKPPEYAQGGVFDAKQQKRNRGAAYATGGVTSQAAYAMLGDNASGKELVIPAEHIDSDHTAGYTRDGGAPIIMNVVTSEDVAAAMEETAGRQVTVNTIGRDMRERRSTYRNVRDASKGRG